MVSLRNKSLRKGFPYFFLIPTLIFLLVITIIPTILGLWWSLHKWHLLAGEPTFIGVMNYVRAFGDPSFVYSLLYSFFFVGSSVTVELLIGLMIAVLLSQELRGGGIIRSLIIIPVVLPDLTVGLMWRLLFNYEAGPVNHLLRSINLQPVHWLETGEGAMAAVFTAEVWQWTPFAAVILTAGILALPKEPFEAARVDGASPLQIFRRITLPLIKPIIILVVLFRVIDAWRAFGMIHLLTHGGPGARTEVITLNIYAQALKRLNFGYGVALSFIALFVVSLIGSRLLKFLRYE